MPLSDIEVRLKEMAGDIERWRGSFCQSIDAGPNYHIGLLAALFGWEGVRDWLEFHKSAAYAEAFQARILQIEQAAHKLNKVVCSPDPVDWQYEYMLLDWAAGDLAGYFCNLAAWLKSDATPKDPPKVATGDAPPNGNAKSILDKDDQAILRTLTRLGRLMFIYDLAKHVELSEKTCGKRIAKLREQGLVERKGTRGGVAITAAGLQALAKKGKADSSA